MHCRCLCFFNERMEMRLCTQTSWGPNPGLTFFFFFWRCSELGSCVCSRSILFRAMKDSEGGREKRWALTVDGTSQLWIDITCPVRQRTRWQQSNHHLSVHWDSRGWAAVTWGVHKQACMNRQEHKQRKRLTRVDKKSLGRKYEVPRSKDMWAFLILGQWKTLPFLPYLPPYLGTLPYMLAVESAFWGPFEC